MKFNEAHACHFLKKVPTTGNRGADNGRVA